uniref:Uncharacterized protein n=1 Tax=Trichogramma kaykai TaxID=54128 RepID=A0ABD2WEP9_9HYME
MSKIACILAITPCLNFTTDMVLTADTVVTEDMADTVVMEDTEDTPVTVDTADTEAVIMITMGIIHTIIVTTTTVDSSTNSIMPITI